MRKRGWTERDRWEDVQTPHADLAEFDLIEPELRAGVPQAIAVCDSYRRIGVDKIRRKCFIRVLQLSYA
jgi:hypothetical protein